MIGFVDDDWDYAPDLSTGHGCGIHSRPPRRRVSIRSHSRHIGYIGHAKIRKAKK